jgi:hypothetical protein
MRPVTVRRFGPGPYCPHNNCVSEDSMEISLFLHSLTHSREKPVTRLVPREWRWRATGPSCTSRLPRSPRAPPPRCVPARCEPRASSCARPLLPRSLPPVVVSSGSPRAAPTRQPARPPGSPLRRRSGGSWRPPARTRRPPATTHSVPASSSARVSGSASRTVCVPPNH